MEGEVERVVRRWGGGGGGDTHARRGDHTLHDQHKLGRQDLRVHVRGAVLHDRVEHLQRVVDHHPVILKETLANVLHRSLDSMAGDSLTSHTHIHTHTHTHTHTRGT